MARMGRSIGTQEASLICRSDTEPYSAGKTARPCVDRMRRLAPLERAHGYLMKDATRAEILTAISSVASGCLHFPQNIAARIEERESRAELSPREYEVLDMLAKGLTNKEIARVLLISQFTVRTHVKHLFKKLGASDRTEAVAIASHQGILSFNP